MSATVDKTWIAELSDGELAHQLYESLELDDDAASAPFEAEAARRGLTRDQLHAAAEALWALNDASCAS